MIIPIIYITHDQITNETVWDVKRDLYHCFDEFSYGIVDARNVTHLGSAGIGLVIEMLTSFRDKYIVFANVDPHILKLLKLDNFSDTMKSRIYDNVDDAMKAVYSYAK